MARAFTTTLWRPGETAESGSKLTPAELSERLLYVEKVLDKLPVEQLPIADLQRKLEQGWLPDPTVLLPAGGITSDLLGNPLPWTAFYKSNLGTFAAAPALYTWNQEVRNENNIVTRVTSNQQLRVNQSGFYTVRAYVLVGGTAGVPAAGRYDVQMRVNGAVVHNTLNNAQAGGIFLEYHLWFEGPLAANDLIDVVTGTFAMYDGTGEWNAITVRKERLA
jgi:hypothetical protein